MVLIECSAIQPTSCLDPNERRPHNHLQCTTHKKLRIGATEAQKRCFVELRHLGILTGQEIGHLGFVRRTWKLTLRERKRVARRQFERPLEATCAWASGI